MTLSERIARQREIEAAAIGRPSVFAPAICAGRLAYDIGRGPSCGNPATHPAHTLTLSPFTRRALAGTLPAAEIGR